MHIPVIWRSKFTDLVNSKKKLNLRKKTAVDKSAWIKACTFQLKLDREKFFVT